MIVKLINRFRPPPATTTWEDYFEAGETLLWSGAPVPGPKFSWLYVFFSAFGLPFLWVGLSLSGGAIINVFTSSSPIDIVICVVLFCFGLPFLAAGLALVFGTWIAASLASDSVRYGLSDRRAYIALSFWNSTMKSYPILKGAALKLTETPLATSVTFASVTEADSDGDKVTKDIGFENISDGAKVYALMREIQKRLPD